MGKLGWSAYDYYCSTPLEFYAACDGYNEKIKEGMMITRYSTYIIASSMAGSKAIGSIEKIWPVEEAKSLPAMTKERYDAILKRHKLKLGGAKNRNNS